MTVAENPDTYITLAEPAEGLYKEKGSKFIALAFPVYSEADIKEKLAEVRKTYFDARHHCYAYLLGAAKKVYRANDDGEPNHSAGDPILGQIRSSGLSNVLVIVVRYFGGTKLGVGGLIYAYKTATAEALSQAQTVEKHETAFIRIEFQYPQMNDVMSLIKEFDLQMASQHFEISCEITVEVRKQLSEKIMARLEKLDDVQAGLLQ
ncbi:YigZ family protein [Adhaeribacter sp. BT258]|uniref:YigZ family protein n=1 Tax=Adhaeribacter terrigena TaxID=2793070 RepID=A0ABS1BY05_9BACT|nr:YigZ family protein [Adhaeribacter terrigena]MBK0402019.1 YigZ family protein [Adhaeribacter terrigena]